ncbi:MAG: ubiquitin-like protein Pup, partial [Actinobacteria bacterium]|nr:ubiquitin-like protein Pup [Actinomycetota bacterium]
GEKIKAELDDLLDEIDEVLEENAEDFVRAYVQKGGE